MANGQQKGLAIVSLVLGILSMILFGILTAIPGIITGHMARSRVKRDPINYGGEGMALAGLILSYLALALSIGAILFILNNPEFMATLQEVQQEVEISPIPQ